MSKGNRARCHCKPWFLCRPCASRGSLIVEAPILALGLPVTIPLALMLIGGGYFLAREFDTDKFKDEVAGKVEGNMMQRLCRRGTGRPIIYSFYNKPNATCTAPWKLS